MVTEPAQQLTAHQAVVELCRERGELATSAFHAALGDRFTPWEIANALEAGLMEYKLWVRFGWTDEGVGRIYSAR